MHLPIELIVHILSYLSSSHKDLSRVSQVDHSLCQAAQDDSLWAACIKHSNSSFWWDLSGIEGKKGKEGNGKRKSESVAAAVPHKQFMRDWTLKTFAWLGSAVVKDVNALILGDPAYSEDFLDWLNVGLYGNKRAAITFSIEATILRLKTQVGSLGKAIVLNKFGFYEQDSSAEAVDVILIHYSDTSTLYCAYMIAQNAKKTFPNAEFVVAGDPSCSPTMLEELCNVVDAKAFIPINYRTALNAATCDSLYSLVLTHGARAAIHNTVPRVSTALHNIHPQSKKPKFSEETAEHTEIRCDGCGVFPIIGTRHVCTACKRVDLCAACVAQKMTVRRGRCARHAFRQIRKFPPEKEEGEKVLEKEEGGEKRGRGENR